jgi:hypothetical protein
LNKPVRLSKTGSMAGGRGQHRHASAERQAQRAVAVRALPGTRALR